MLTLASGHHDWHWWCKKYWQMDMAQNHKSSTQCSHSFSIQNNVVQFYSMKPSMWRYGSFKVCREKYNQMNLLLHFEAHLKTVKNVCHGFQCTDLLIPNKSMLPVESFWDVLVCKSSIHNPMQQFLCHMYFHPAGHLFHETPQNKMKWG